MEIPKEGSLLYKICTGEATEEEKKIWQDQNNLPNDIVEQLKTCCNIGYQMASELDSSPNEFEVFKQEIRSSVEKLQKQIEELRELIVQKKIE